MIPFDRGGLTGNLNTDTIVPTDMVHPTRNIDLSRGGREPRGGTDHLTTQFTSTYNGQLSGGADDINGLYHFRTRAGSDFLIAGADDGTIYSEHDNTIKTGFGNNKWYDFETFANELYIVNGGAAPELWTGAGNTSTLTDIPSDWGTWSAYPQWVEKHGRGASERLWMGGVPGNEYRIYASVNADGDDLSDANVTTIDIETQDGLGIVVGREWGDKLLCFGKRSTYIIDDADIDIANWGYYGSQWEGGAATFRLVAKVPNDIIAMMEDGEIYSVRAGEAYGDYQAASLTRPAFMHHWIKEHVDLSEIAKFHMVYNPYLKALMIFVVRKPNTSVDTALVYFTERDPKEAWMVYSNQSYTSGYSAVSSAVVREAAGTYKVYTGGYSGYVWTLETTSNNDNGNAYYAGFRTPWLAFDNPRISKHYKRAWMVMQSKGGWDVTIDWWIDGVQKTQRSVSLVGKGSRLDDTDYGLAPAVAPKSDFVLGGEELSDKVFELGDSGKRLQLEIYNSTVDQDFFLSQIMIDNRPLTVEAG